MGTYLPRMKSLLYQTWTSESSRCASVQKSGSRTIGCLPPTPMYPFTVIWLSKINRLNFTLPPAAPPPPPPPPSVGGNGSRSSNRLRSIDAFPPTRLPSRLPSRIACGRPRPPLKPLWWFADDDTGPFEGILQHGPSPPCSTPVCTRTSTTPDDHARRTTSPGSFRWGQQCRAHATPFDCGGCCPPPPARTPTVSNPPPQGPTSRGTHPVVAPCSTKESSVARTRPSSNHILGKRGRGEWRKWGGGARERRGGRERGRKRKGAVGKGGGGQPWTQ